MSLGDLQAKLNPDLERFPPPESPDPRRRTGRWGRSSVKGLPAEVRARAWSTQLRLWVATGA
jgi:hypothetical protein